MRKVLSIILCIILSISCFGCFSSSSHIHIYDNSSTSPSVLNKCIFNNCNVGKMPAKNNYYDELIESEFDNKLLETMDGLYNNLIESINMISNISQEEFELYKDNIKENFKQFEKNYKILIAYYQYSKIKYDIKANKDNSNNYDKFSEMYNKYKIYYYELIYLISKTSLKDYVLNYSEETYKLVEKEYLAGLNEELQTLIKQNLQLKFEARKIDSLDTSNKVPTLYKQIVDNNNKQAKIYNYDSYIEYAFESIYNRNYDYKESLEYCEKVKKYIVPLYTKIKQEYNILLEKKNFSKKENEYFKAITTASFFTNTIANQLVNDYMKQMNNNDTMLFDIVFEDLFSNGNYFLGEYNGAYEWNVNNFGKPILYFGPNHYQSPFTIIHEFGHYMEDYKYNNSYISNELLETHSQGNELMFLAYLKNKIKTNVFNIIETGKILETLEIIIRSAVVNIFEIATYKHIYNGSDEEKYLLDMEITPNEYDELFQSILKDYGLDNSNLESYWRYLVDFKHVYFISYSMSALTSLQIYAYSKEIGFEESKDKYFKLFTYNDVNEKFTYEEVLEYSGLYNYDDDSLFEFINKVYS